MYSEDKGKAKEWLKVYGHDLTVQELIEELKKPFYSHSDRWSIAYDALTEMNMDFRKVVTGFVYLVEDGEI